MEQRHTWQQTVLERLLDGRGRSLKAGTIFAEVMDLIPLHHGGRAAYRAAPDGVLSRENPLSATQMRWHAFRQYVTSLNLGFEPSLAPRRPLTMAHHMKVPTTDCPDCGEPYLGRKGREGHQGCRPDLHRAEPALTSAYAFGRVVLLDHFRRRD